MTKISPTLRVLIIDNDVTRRTQLVTSLQANHYQVLEQSSLSVELLQAMPQLQPDIIVIDSDAPDRDTLEHLCMLSQDQPRPIVMFTENEDDTMMRQAIQAGVTSYVVKGIAPERIKPVLQVAMLRFEEHQNLRKDLAQAQSQLAERKIIERAKGIVMQQKNINENAAYNLLRKMAMERNVKLADIATQIVDLAQAFG